MTLWKKKKSDHEMGLKFSVYHSSRTPTRCPVAFCFQMKMLVQLRSYSKVLTRGPGSESERRSECSEARALQCGFRGLVHSEHLRRRYWPQPEPESRPLCPQQRRLATDHEHPLHPLGMPLRSPRPAAPCLLHGVEVSGSRPGLRHSVPDEKLLLSAILGRSSRYCAQW